MDLGSSSYLRSDAFRNLEITNRVALVRVLEWSTWKRRAGRVRWELEHMGRCACGVSRVLRRRESSDYGMYARSLKFKAFDRRCRVFFYAMASTNFKQKQDISTFDVNCEGHVLNTKSNQKFSHRSLPEPRMSKTAVFLLLVQSRQMDVTSRESILGYAQANRTGRYLLWNLSAEACVSSLYSLDIHDSAGVNDTTAIPSTNPVS